MTVTLRPASRERAGWSLARDVAFPTIATVAIVGYADIRIPMGLPGHRGLIWLTLLVAVVLLANRRATVLAVGAAATITTPFIDGGTGAVAGAAGSVRYLAAAIALYAVAAVPMLYGRRWLVALAAAPIHLVALADSVAVLLGRGYPFGVGSVGMAEKALFHLGFGLGAGLLGWAIASGIDRTVGRAGDCVALR